MRANVWVRDLWTAAWKIVVGILGAASTIAAVVSLVAGAHLAAPWFLVGALACLLVIVFSAYVSAARVRDTRLSEHRDHDALTARIADLERAKVSYRDNGDGTITISQGEDEGPTSGLSPSPLTRLTWNGADYEPAVSKQWHGPKEFVGPVDPALIPGVLTNEADTWLRT